MKSDDQKKLLNKADKCPHNYSCQTTEGKPLCEISETINDSVFFLECRASLGCSYQHSFGNSFMCTCPVRQTIYKEKRI